MRRSKPDNIVLAHEHGFLLRVEELHTSPVKHAWSLHAATCSFAVLQTADHIKPSATFLRSSPHVLA